MKFFFIEILFVVFFLCPAGKNIGQIIHPWPFSISGSNHYLLDNKGTPYWLNGDSPWSLLVQPTMEEAKEYMTHRYSQGFNALLINVLERRYSDFAPLTTEDRIAPFEIEDQIDTPNDSYFRRLDRLLDFADSIGMTIFLCPAYLGYLNDGDGWYDVILKNGVKRSETYGKFIAERYGLRRNVIWVMGGDHNPDEVLPMINSIAFAILKVNPNAVITAHTHHDNSPRDQYKDADWLNLSNVYSYKLLHDALSDEYFRVPIKPYILLEAAYENERGSSPSQIRKQQWWAVCNGATGGFMGNNPIWEMKPGWKEQLNSPGAKGLAVVKRIVGTIPWYTYSPDIKKEILKEGWGEFNSTDYAGFAFGSSGAVGYFPTPRDITLSLRNDAKLTWINPENGEEVKFLNLKRGTHKIEYPVREGDILVLIGW